MLRKTLETVKVGIDKILRNISGEGRKFVSHKKRVSFFVVHWLH